MLYFDGDLVSARSQASFLNDLLHDCDAEGGRTKFHEVGDEVDVDVNVLDVQNVLVFKEKAPVYVYRDGRFNW